MLRQALQTGSLPTWIRALSFALDLASWSADGDASSLAQACDAEIDRLVDVHLQYELGGLIDRKDYLAQLRVQLGSPDLAFVPPSIIELLRDGWCESPEYWRQRLTSWLALWAAAPNQILPFLDMLDTQGSLLLPVLGSMIEEISQADIVPDDRERMAQARRETHRAAALWEPLSYDEVRASVLEFCINRRLELIEVRRQLQFNTPGGCGYLVKRLEDDRPLDLVIRGILAFWS